MLAAITLLIGAGAYTVAYYQSWRGPSPIYFEFFLWPIYAVFAAATFRPLYYAGSVLYRRIADSLPKLTAKMGNFPVFQLAVALDLRRRGMEFPQ